MRKTLPSAGGFLSIGVEIVKLISILAVDE
jgi:hypothetical protein